MVGRHCPFHLGTLYFQLCVKVLVILQSYSYVGATVSFSLKKQNQLRTCSATSFSSFAVPLTVSTWAGEWAGVPEPGARPPSSAKAITPGPRQPPVPIPPSSFKSFKRHYRVPTTCQALCWVWVGWAECLPLGCHIMKTQKGTSLTLGIWGNFPKEAILELGCQDGQVGFSWTIERSFSGKECYMQILRVRASELTGCSWRLVE